MIKLDFKTDKIRREFESGNLKMKLNQILKLGMEYLSIEYPNIDYTIVITDILRTQDEQDKIYLNHKDPKKIKQYKKKPWLSVHQFWRGLDLRVSNMPKDMAKKLYEFFNKITYDSKRPKKDTCLLHDVGTGAHIHLQVIG